MEWTKRISKEAKTKRTSTNWIRNELNISIGKKAPKHIGPPHTHIIKGVCIKNATIKQNHYSWTNDEFKIWNNELWDSGDEDEDENWSTKREQYLWIIKFIEESWTITNSIRLILIMRLKVSYLYFYFSTSQKWNNEQRIDLSMLENDNDSDDDSWLTLASILNRFYVCVLRMRCVCRSDNTATKSNVNNTFQLNTLLCLAQSFLVAVVLFVPAYSINEHNRRRRRRRRFCCCRHHSHTIGGTIKCARFIPIKWNPIDVVAN